MMTKENDRVKKLFDFIKTNIFIIMILILGVVLRIALLGIVPGNGNLNQDEAFAAYEAYSISTYGIDSHGYHNPVYLEAWGSGMNALETYLMIPFIKIFGLNPVTVRLPQAIIGCLTILFTYLLFLQLSDKKVATWGAFVLAVSPWHIMLSRWGLESSLLVGILTIAIYFFVSANHKLWRIVLSAIFMGLSLYCYATVWLILPLIVLALIIVSLLTKQINWKEIAIFCVILALFAIPLLLFVVINLGYIDEINSFISIPKLGYFRNNEIKFSVENLKRLLHILWTQDDGEIWNSTSHFGLFYHFTRIFIPLGVLGVIAKKSKKSIPILVWLFISFAHGTLVEADFNRINTIFIPIIYLIATGIAFFVSIIEQNYKKIFGVSILACYCFSLVVFLRYYTGEYSRVMAEVWFDGFKTALERASSSSGTIHINYGDVSYPMVLYYTKYPTDKFVESVVYWDPTANFLHPTYFEGYDMTDITLKKPVPGETYICYKGHLEAMDYLQAYGMECEEFGNYVVGKMP